MSISPVNSYNIPVVAQNSANSQLDQTDFLRLMTAQLKEQDPFAPVDNQQMVAQMAQFSSVAGISEMNGSLKAIATQIAEQTAILQEIRTATAAPAPATV